jgi:hypothetical protein
MDLFNARRSEGPQETGLRLDLDQIGLRSDRRDRSSMPIRSLQFEPGSRLDILHFSNMIALGILR